MLQMKKLSNLKELLHTAAYHSIEIDRYMDPKRPAILAFDPELGYLHRNHCMQDGMDGAITSGTYAVHGGHRSLVNYKDGYPVHGFPWMHVRYDLAKRGVG
jgi:hypothetical protein